MLHFARIFPSFSLCISDFYIILPIVLQHSYHSMSNLHVWIHSTAVNPKLGKNSQIRLKGFDSLVCVFNKQKQIGTLAHSCPTDACKSQLYSVNTREILHLL